MIKERVTVDFDEESYYLDGEYWVSWDNYGEEMAEKINELLDKQDKKIKELEEENASMKGRIINAIVKSNQVECNCSPCICEDYVNEELKKW